VYHGVPGGEEAMGTPDGATWRVMGFGDSELQREVLSSLRPATAADMGAIEASTSAILQSLPEVGGGTVGEARIVLRGGTADDPQAQCLVLTGQERCRRVVPTGPSEDSSWAASVDIDGRWYLFGHQASDDPSLMVLPWMPAMSTSIDSSAGLLAPVTASSSDGLRWWVSEVPAGFDDVILVDVAATEIPTWQLNSAFRRRDWP